MPEAEALSPGAGDQQAAAAADLRVLLEVSLACLGLWLLLRVGVRELCYWMYPAGLAQLAVPGPGRAAWTGLGLGLAAAVLPWLLVPLGFAGVSRIRRRDLWGLGLLLVGGSMSVQGWLTWWSGVGPQTRVETLGLGVVMSIQDLVDRAPGQLPPVGWLAAIETAHAGCIAGLGLSLAVTGRLCLRSPRLVLGEARSLLLWLFLLGSLLILSMEQPSWSGAQLLAGLSFTWGRSGAWILLGGGSPDGSRLVFAIALVGAVWVVQSLLRRVPAAGEVLCPLRGEMLAGLCCGLLFAQLLGFGGTLNGPWFGPVFAVAASPSPLTPSAPPTDFPFAFLLLVLLLIVRVGPGLGPSALSLLARSLLVAAVVGYLLPAGCAQISFSRTGNLDILAFDPGPFWLVGLVLVAVLWRPLSPHNLGHAMGRLPFLRLDAVAAALLVVVIPQLFSWLALALVSPPFGDAIPRRDLLFLTLAPLCLLVRGRLSRRRCS